MTHESNLNKEDWENLLNELSELRDEFIQRKSKGRNDFKYNTEFLANLNRKKEIINKSVQLIRSNYELNHFIFADENNEYNSTKEKNDYLEHMEAGGFWKESNYYNYIFKIIRFIENKLD